MEWVVEAGHTVPPHHLLHSHNIISDSQGVLVTLRKCLVRGEKAGERMRWWSLPCSSGRC